MKWTGEDARRSIVKSFSSHLVAYNDLASRSNPARIHGHFALNLHLNRGARLEPNVGTAGEHSDRQPGKSSNARADPSALTSVGYGANDAARRSAFGR
jgi:hypothetical protein